MWFLRGTEATEGPLSRDICAMAGGAGGEVNTHLPISPDHKIPNPVQYAGFDWTEKDTR